MLCVNKYKQEYIDECRPHIKSQFASYRTLLAAAKERSCAWSSLASVPIKRLAFLLTP